MKGFKRPLNTKHLLKHITKFGAITTFWMNNIKTDAYLTFEDEDAARACRKAMWGRRYPPDMPPICSGKIDIEYCSSAVVAEKSGEPEPVKKQGAPPVEPAGISELLERSEGRPVKRRRVGGQVDSLFQKTRTRPLLYWMALTDDEIKKKETKKRLGHEELLRTVERRGSGRSERGPPSDRERRGGDRRGGGGGRGGAGEDRERGGRNDRDRGRDRR